MRFSSRATLRVLFLSAALSGACGGGEGGDAAQDLAYDPGAEAPAPGGEEAAGPGPLPDPATYGVLSGVVRYDGRVPEKQEFNITSGACLEHHDGPVTTEYYEIVDGRVQNTLVFLQRGLHPELVFEPPQEEVLLDQLGCVYRPHVFALQVGQPLRIANNDDEAHNVRTANIKRNRVINDNIPPLKRDTMKLFERAEAPVKLVCDIHPWMSAYFGIFDHPYFAVTGPDGSFRFENVPPGRYRLRAVHEELGRIDQEVVLDANGAAGAEFVYTEADLPEKTRARLGG